MRYSLARLEENQKGEVYRIYVTDALKLLTENTARYVGGSSLTVRYADIGKPRDERTGDEIAADIIKRMGLVVSE